MSSFAQVRWSMDSFFFEHVPPMNVKQQEASCDVKRVSELREIACLRQVALLVIVEGVDHALAPPQFAPMFQRQLAPNIWS